MSASRTTEYFKQDAIAMTAVQCTQAIGRMSSVVFLEEMLEERAGEATCELEILTKSEGK